MRTLRSFFFIAISILTACIGSNGSPETPIVVSMLQLIATPERFDGKLVSVTGFIHIGREQDLLFLGEQDFNHAVYENAVWFHLSEDMAKESRKLNRNYVGLVGVFSTRHEGPYGCPNGGLSIVKRYQLWSLLSNPTGLTLDQSKKHQ